jgi:hypothetical protein
MKAFTKSIFAAFLLVFISCNPDEDLDNNGNSGNNGNNGNNGGGNTINPVSYPEIVSLLAGNWVGDSIVRSLNNNLEVTIDDSGTSSIGYLTFGSTEIGSVSLTPFEAGIQPPPIEDLLVAKYPASVTITNGSWSGSGGEVLSNYAIEFNAYSDKSYCIVNFTTPFFDLNTPTIQYGIVTRSYYGPYGSDIYLGATAGVPEQLLPYLRIHTLNANSLILVGPYMGWYQFYYFSRQ